MANGDAASAAGMDVLDPATADLRDGADEINKTRDYLAEHQTSGTHDASAITTGTLGVARIPVLPMAKLPAEWTGSVDAGGGAVKGGNFAALGGIAAGGAVVAGGDLGVSGTIINPTAYASVVSSGRTLAVRADGTFGYFPSARRFKKNIRPADIDPAALLDLEPVQFDYKAAHGGHHDVGLIAEDVAPIFPWLVYDGDKDGEVDGLEYARLVVPLIATVKWLAARVTELENGADQ